jgi:hypothetical protein
MMALPGSDELLNVSQRAMAAARETIRAVAQQEGSRSVVRGSSQSQWRLGKLYGVDRSAITAAKAVLTRGTKEEIAACDAGKASVSTIGRQIMTGISADKRFIKNDEQYESDANLARFEKLRVNKAIGSQFSEALRLLTGFPRPEDVVPIVRSNVHWRNNAEKNLQRALEFMKGFHHVWDSTQAHARGGPAGQDHDDARDGDAVPRPEQDQSAA